MLAHIISTDGVIIRIIFSVRNAHNKTVIFYFTPIFKDYNSIYTLMNTLRKKLISHWSQNNCCYIAKTANSLLVTNG